MGSMSSVVSGLGSLSTALTTVSAAASTLKSLSNGLGDSTGDNYKAQQNLAMQQLKQQQAANFLDQQERSALEQQKIAADSAAGEQQRQAALRRAVARQRVSFGAQGLATGDGGSAQAVLLGLFDESEDEKTTRERMDNLRLNALSQDLNAQQRINVLQRSQLEEQQNLSRIAAGY